VGYRVEYKTKIIWVFTPEEIQGCMHPIDIVAHYVKPHSHLNSDRRALLPAVRRVNNMGDEKKRAQSEMTTVAYLTQRREPTELKNI
jgi:hypothetical protein